jgi:hypothetical protein
LPSNWRTRRFISWLKCAALGADIARPRYRWPIKLVRAGGSATCLWAMGRSGKLAALENK